MLEKSYLDRCCSVLEWIANNRVTDQNVERMTEDLRQELSQVMGVGQISEFFYERWDRIISGLHQPDDDEMEAMRLYEGMYGGVEDGDYRCPVDIYDGEPEGRIVATCSVPF